MAKRKTLSKKQLAVLDDLFSGELDEYAVLAKHKVTRALYYRWLTDDAFVEQFDRHIAYLSRQGAALLARYATVAAAKLVQLTESDNPETARKACLDILTLDLHSSCDVRDASREKPTRLWAERTTQDAPRITSISPATASRLLAALAKGMDDSETP
jgi:hypothetical protein